MSLRIQFSLRTLLLLTLLICAGLVFVVLPWQHWREQLAILERVRNDYGLSVEKIEGQETYAVQNFDSNYDNFNDELIRLINSSELISAVKLEFYFDTKNRVDLSRLLQLRTITELDLQSVTLNDDQMQVLRQLPLKVLKISTNDSQFQIWPINNQLAEFHYRGWDDATYSFRLSDHAKLRQLDLQCYDAKNCVSFEIRNCPALENCHIRIGLDTRAQATSSSLTISELPKLEFLSLCYSRFEPAHIEIQKLPRVHEFDLEGIRWKRVDESKHWVLKSVYYTHDQQLDDQEWAAILNYSDLETLGLSVPHPMDERFDIPLLSEMKNFNFGFRDQVLRNPSQKRISATLALNYLEKMPNLRQVYLVLDRFTPELQKQITSYSDFYSVGLLVKDEFPSLDFLRQFPALLSLRLSCSKFSPEQTKLLGSLAKVNELILNSPGNQISDFSSLQQHRGWKVLFNEQDIRKAGSTIPTDPALDFSEVEPAKKIVP